MTGTGGSTGGNSNGGTAAVDSMRDPIENDPDCPASDPEADSECPEMGLVCKYGSDPDCRSRWVCGQVCDPVCGSELAWAQNYAHRDCPGECPSSEPTPGDPCDMDHELCTFGDDPACRTLWECLDGSWVALVPERDCQSEDVYCAPEPVGFASCDASQVTPPGGRCVYEHGYSCGCSCVWDIGGQDASGLQINWYCAIPSPLTVTVTPRCPLAPPDAGTPCSGDAVCDYAPPDICETYSSALTVASCASGMWEVTP